MVGAGELGPMTERDWRQCPTHPDVDGARMWGCPDCVVELRREVEALRTALRPFAQLMAESPAWKAPALVPDSAYVHVPLGDVRRAAAAYGEVGAASPGAPE